MQKGFAPIIILIGILILASVGGAYYFFKVKTPVQKACTMDAKVCQDGTSVGRVGPNCEFAPCPKSSPSPTPNEAANWKTYTNAELGFSIKYPPTFSINENTASQDISRKNKIGNKVEFKSSQNSPIITIGVTKIPPYLSIQQAVDQRYSNIDYYHFSDFNFQSFSIDGISGVHSKGGVASQEYAEDVFVIKDGRLYQFNFSSWGDHSKDQDNLRIFDQIISTFKFL